MTSSDTGARDERADIERLQLALDSSRAGTWRWDMATGVVTWDARLEALHGLPTRGFRGNLEHWLELLHPEDAGDFVATLHMAVEQSGSCELLARVSWPDGTIHWIECRGQVTVDAVGAPTGTAGIAFDVTDRKRVEEELRESRSQLASLAQTLQESLLGPPVLVEGAGHAARYVPAAARLDVGGDWYNAQRLPDGRIAVAIGDVVGKGLVAAAVMGQLRSALSAAAIGSANAEGAIETLDLLAHSVPGAYAASVVLAFVDLEDEVLEYSRAGHPPPLLVSPEGKVEVLDGGCGWPLAIHDGGRRRPGGTAPFSPGSLLVLYSDGLIERADEPIDESLQRLAAALERRWNEPLELLADHLLDELGDEKIRNDDVALLVLRSPVVNEQIFLRKVPASPEQLRVVRAALQTWLEQLELDPEEAADVKLAVTEACANAVKHAYRSGHGLFRVEASHIGDELICCITDTGSWRDDEQGPRDGRGVAIMRHVMDELELLRRPTGTSVVMRRKIRARD